MAISVVNASNATDAAATSVTSSPTFTSTSGNLLIAGGAQNGATAEGATPWADGGTNTWTDSHSTSTSSATFAAAGYAKNITGKSGEAVTFTLNANQFPSVCLLEVAGCDATSPLSVAWNWKVDNGGGAGRTSLTTNSITPAAGDHILVFVGVLDASGQTQSVTNGGAGTATWHTTVGSSSLLDNTGTNEPMGMAYAIVTADGSTAYAATHNFGFSSPSDWVGGIAAFKVAGAAGPVSGTLAANLPGLTIAASGAETFSGTAAANLTNLSAATSGLETFTGTAAANLPALRVIARGAPAYPLKADATNQYLVDQNGVPVLLMADSPWTIEVQLTNADIDLYLADRAQKGFNAILFEVIEHHFGTHAPSNIDSVSPWTGATFTTPNNTYFNRVDYIVQQASNYGICCFLFPLYLGFGFGSEGWSTEVAAASTADMQSWADYLATRYSGFDNIVWVIGGDVNPSGNATIQARTNDFATELAISDTRHLITAHNARGTTAHAEWSGATWLTLNDTYSTQLGTPGDAQTADSISLPFFQIENQYEGEDSATDQQVRSQAWWTLLGAGSGAFMGNNSVWAFNGTAGLAFGDGSQPNDWKAALNSNAAKAWVYFRGLAAPLRWQRLVPDPSHLTVTSGFGTLGSADYVGAGRSSEGTLAMAYVPTGASIVVDLSRFSGHITAQWFDPSIGTLSTDAASPLAPTGTHTFAGHGTNSGGASDWVLLLQAPIEGTAAANLPSLTMAAIGSVGSGILGTLAADLPGLTIAAAGLETFTGALAANPPALQMVASGTSGGGAIGTLVANLPGLVVSAAGVETILGSLVAALPALHVQASGTGGTSSPVLVVTHTVSDAPLYTHTVFDSALFSHTLSDGEA